MTRVDYLQELLHCVDSTPKLTTMCHYLSELALLDYGLSRIRPSVASYGVIAVMSGKLGVSH